MNGLCVVITDILDDKTDDITETGDIVNWYAGSSPLLCEKGW